MKTHDLKCWPTYFEAIFEDRKTFEVRKDDREFEVGDILHLEHYDPETSIYNGSFIDAHVTYIMKGPEWGIEAGHCVLGIKVFYKYLQTFP